MPKVSERTHCNICGTEVSKANLSRHRKSCRNGLQRCTDCQYATKSKADMDYHRIRSHSVAPIVTNECAVCKEIFPGFYQLQTHKRQVHGTTRRIPQEVSVDLDNFVDEPEAQEALQDFKHLLVERTTKTKVQTVANFPLSEYRTDTIFSKLDDVFNDLPCAAKINVSLGVLTQKHRDWSFPLFLCREQ